MEEKTRFSGIPFKIPPKISSIVVLAIGFVLNLWGKFASLNIGAVQNPDGYTMPYYLWADSVGTFFAAAVLGPVAGIIVGLIGNVMVFSLDHTAIFYTLVSVAIGASVGCLYPRKKLALGSLGLVTLLSIALVLLLCTPLNMYFYGGRPGTVVGNSVYDSLCAGGMPGILSAILAESAVDIPDKLLSILIATGFFCIYKKVVKE